MMDVSEYGDAGSSVTRAYRAQRWRRAQVTKTHGRFAGRMVASGRIKEKRSPARAAASASGFRGSTGVVLDAIVKRGVAVEITVMRRRARCSGECARNSGASGA
jgi:hypothetical protein